MDKLIVAILLAVITTAILVFVGVIMALPVMLLWNWLLSGANSIIGMPLPEIGFMKAWGLLILCGLLFKSSSTSSNK